MIKKLSAVAAAPLAAVLLLAGCGGTGDDATTGAGTTFNDADVAFAQAMIPHHRQAIEMAEFAADRAASREVKALAADIEKAQDPEIETMISWLRARGEDVPDDTSGMGHDGTGDGMGEGMDEGGMDMPGMVPDEDMRGLDRATGGQFDRMFLQMMIRHHEGAIEMARTEQADGENADVVALAKQIETDQSAEIATMRKLLDS